MVDNFTSPRLTIGLKTKQLAERILSFGEMLCGIQLYRYQYKFSMAIITAVLRRTGDSPTALFCRQSGKTESVAVVSIACAIMLPILAREFPDDDRVGMFRKGFRVGIYAPKDKQAKLAYDRVRKYAESDRASEIYADREINIELTASRGDSCAWSHGSVVHAETASEQTDNEGQTWHLLICDESQKLSAFKISKQLEPMLSTSNGPLVQIGTATSSKGYFFRAIESNIASERSTGRQLHFQYDYEQVVSERRAKYDAEVKRWKAFQAAPPARQAELLVEYRVSRVDDLRPDVFHLNYQKAIEKVLRRLRGNIEDEAFKMNYRLLWLDNRDIAIPEIIIRSSAIPSLEMNRPGAVGFVTGGLDIAKGQAENADTTVLTFTHTDIDKPIVDPMQVGKPDNPLIHYNKTIIGCYAFQGTFEGEQYAGIVNACRMYPTLRLLLCDSTGMGDPVTERLAVLMHWTTVEGISWAHVSNKSMVYKNYLEEWKSGRIRYAAGPETQLTREHEEFVDQHVGLQRIYLNSGYLTCEAEEGAHDDYPDSGALSIWASKLALEAGTPIEAVVESSPFVGARPPSTTHGDGRKSRQDRYRLARPGKSYRRG